MKQEWNEVPVACALYDAELRQRKATLLTRFHSAAIAIVELPDGYEFQIPGDKKWILLAAELIAAERECCPFLKLELTVQPGHGPVKVRVTGPFRAKEFVMSTFCGG